jgi:hypothetical protein
MTWNGGSPFWLDWNGLNKGSRFWPACTKLDQQKCPTKTGIFTFGINQIFGSQKPLDIWFWLNIWHFPE